MDPKNLSNIQRSFTLQAQNFEKKGLNMSKQDYLDYTVRRMNLTPDDCVLEAAAGTCICGRSVAPFVKSVTCLDATPAMLAVGEEAAVKMVLRICGLSTGMLKRCLLIASILIPSLHAFPFIILQIRMFHFRK